MASKSKRRRRVLGASCILAALIIAASSFAWFTSKDEVTNRLTANADYGVSIVESFAPPANWLPGQTVNKDVYDVNTGNIAAFVKNDVSGVLSYTYEMKTNTRDANCIKLNKLQVQTIDGVTTNEGGGFLAWTDAANVDVGAINSARTADSITDTWEPTVAGTYIFRRKINTSATGGSTFTYAGYYFDGRDYYKIVIGEDNYRAESGQQFDLATPQDKLRDGSGNALAADAIDPVNGTITADSLKIYYVKDVEITNQNVVFTLDKDAGNKPYLKVEYTAAPADVTDATNNVVYDASADAARKEIDYYNKLGDSNKATVIYEQTKADYDYKSELATQSNALRNAAITRQTASTTTSQKETELSGKWNALTSKATDLVTQYVGLKGTNFYEVGPTATTTGVAGTLFSASQIARIEDTTSVPVLTSSQNNLTTLKNLYNEIKSLDSDLKTEINKISGTTYLTPAELDVIVTTIQGKLDTLANKLVAYSNAYSLITDDPNTATQLGLSATDADSKKAALNALSTQIATLKTGMNTEVSQYKDAYSARDGAVADEAAAQTAWLAAIDTYNTKVSEAKTAYNSVVNKTAPAIQTPTAASYSNDGDTIVPTYTLNNTTTAADPTIDKTTYTNGYDTIAGLTAVTMPTVPATPTIEELKQQMIDAIAATNAAESAYNDAKIAVASNSKITINVYLDENYANNWQMDADTDKTQKVSFYLKSILDAGATTDKLIDKVVLADTVTANDYKNMTFDLNVALDSAQVVYDNDQSTILPTAVNNNGAFDMKATVGNDNTTVTWAANTP